jgi:hypothetical protein
MTPDQIQDIVMGTVHGMMVNGDLVTEMQRDTAMDMQEEDQMEQQMAQPQQPQGMMPPEGMPPEQMPPQGMPQ